MRWFCRIGFGPGPSAGGFARIPKGFATVATSPKKNAATKPITASAPVPSRSCMSRTCRRTTAVYPASTSVHSTTLPESADHAVEILNSSGVARAEFSAT